MQKFYIAGIVPESAETGGGYSVYFPDLPNVAAGGETIEEAIGNAADGLYLALRGIVERNGEIPVPSTLETVRERVKAEREQDELPCPEDTLYQYIAVPALDMVPVRVNVTIPKASLEEIDAKARKYGYTRSGFLARAALEYTQ
jgi:predicted RNase H-like HicB family nuclease